MELNRNVGYQDQDQPLPEAITLNILSYSKNILAFTLSAGRKSIGLFHCSTLTDGGSSILPSGSSKVCATLRYE